MQDDGKVLPVEIDQEYLQELFADKVLLALRTRVSGAKWGHFADLPTPTPILDRFRREELPKKPKVLADQERHVLWFKAQAGFKRLRDVTPALLSEMKGKFLTETARNEKLRKPQTWNRYLTSISCVFECCCRDWQWLEQNPARRVRREREAPGRVRFLSDQERNALLEACKKSRFKNLYPLVALTLATGMRRGEVWRLLVADKRAYSFVAVREMPNL